MKRRSIFRTPSSPSSVPFSLLLNSVSSLPHLLSINPGTFRDVPLSLQLRFSLSFDDLLKLVSSLKLKNRKITPVRRTTQLVSDINSIPNVVSPVNPLIVRFGLTFKFHPTWSTPVLDHSLPSKHL